MEKVYLLLRNNVQSGPYSYTQLLKQSLKPTDLIWIEGVSTAWINPAELEELQKKNDPHASVATVECVVPLPTHVSHPEAPVKTLKSLPQAGKNLDTHPTPPAIRANKPNELPRLTTTLPNGEEIDFRIHKKGVKMVSLDQLAAAAFIALVAGTAWYGRHQLFTGQEHTLSSVAPVSFISEQTFAAKKQPAQAVVEVPPAVATDSVVAHQYAEPVKTYAAAKEIATSAPAANEPIKTAVADSAPAEIAVTPLPEVKKQKPQATETIPSSKEIKAAVTENEVAVKKEEVAPATEENSDVKKKKSLGQAIKGIFKKKKKDEEQPADQ